MLRRSLIPATAIAAVLAIAPAPAEARPPGDLFVTIAYYSDATRTQLIGERWIGCGYPEGHYGAESIYQRDFFSAC
jgi:hypothetical protein